MIKPPAACITRGTNVVDHDLAGGVVMSSTSLHAGRVSARVGTR